MPDVVATDRRLRIILAVVVLAMVAIASGGPIQVLFSAYFWCGRGGSGRELHVVMAIAAIQVFLFLLGQYSPRASRAYHASQWIGLLVCATQIVMLAQAYPLTASLLGLSFAISFALAVFMLVRDLPEGFGAVREGGLRPRLPYLVSIATLLTVTWLVASGLIAQFFLYRPATPLTEWPLAFCLVGGALIALTGAWSFHRRNFASFHNLTLAAFPPLFVLLLALLRAKYPDGGSDTFLYKGTWPYQIAEWRTAGMAALDHVGLGSNFQEMFGGLMIILARDYNPSLISTLSVAALFAVLPCCINLSNVPHGLRRLAFGFATAIVFALTEPALAQGTTYHEPFMVLLLVLALLNVWIWPIFAAGAIAVKLTAVFALPLVFLVRLVPPYRIAAALHAKGLAFIGACALIGLFIAPQVDRNLIYTGRLTGFTETLVRVTDPPGPTATLAPGVGLLGSERPRGGIVNNFLLSTCNMFALELFCDTKYRDNDNLGFHIIASSRAPLAGLLLALAVLLAAAVRRTGRSVAVGASVTYIACYFLYLTQVTQGRYFVVPGFACAVLILCVAPAWLGAFPNNVFSGRRASWIWIALLALLPASDLLVGIYMNDGWECRRPLFARYETLALNRPEKNVQRFVADIAAKYRKACPPPGLSPTVVASPGLLEGPYMGVHVATAWYAHDMRRRFFQIDPAREKNIPLAILAVVARNDAERAQYTRSQDSEYAQCFEDKDLKIYCSKKLAPVGSSCARSTYEGLGPLRAPGQRVE